MEITGNPQNTGSSNEIVDLAHLELFTEGDLDEEKLLIGIFVPIGKESLKTMNEHINDDAEHGLWRSAAHKLKGSSGQIGANALSALCLKAEHGYGLPEADKKNLLVAIEQEFEKVENFFASRQK